MGLSSLLKQLKKKFRTNKRRLSLGVVIITLGAAAGTVYSQQQTGQIREAAAAASMHALLDPGQAMREQILSVIAGGSGPREVSSEKEYVCGEEKETLGAMDPDSIIRYSGEHPEKEVVLQADGSVLFREHIQDLSKRCKENAYFGLDRSDNLSLFEGVPAKEQVIRTFFQMNVGHLKSSLPPETWKQLYSGIPVSDLAEYNSILSTFSDYAADRVKPPM